MFEQVPKVFNKFIPINLFNIDTQYVNSDLSSITSSSSDSESLFVLAVDGSNGTEIGTNKNLYVQQQGKTYEIGAPVELVNYRSSNSRGQEEYVYCSNQKATVDDLRSKVVIPLNMRGLLGNGHFGEKDILLRNLRFSDLDEDFLEELKEFILSIIPYSPSVEPSVNRLSIWNTSENTNNFTTIGVPLQNNSIDGSVQWVNQTGAVDDREDDDKVDFFSYVTDSSIID